MVKKIEPVNVEPYWYLKGPAPYWYEQEGVTWYNWGGLSGGLCEQKTSLKAEINTIKDSHNPNAWEINALEEVLSGVEHSISNFC